MESLLSKSTRKAGQSAFSHAIDPDYEQAMRDHAYSIARKRPLPPTDQAKGSGDLKEIEEEKSNADSGTEKE